MKETCLFYYLRHNHAKLSLTCTVALLAQANKVLCRPDSSLFCCDTGSIGGRSIFFSVLFLYFFQKPDIYFKKPI